MKRYTSWLLGALVLFAEPGLATFSIEIGEVASALYSGEGGSGGTLVVGITASRTACRPPCIVYLEAYSATDAGAYDSFHDMHYSWDFDDPGSGNHPAGDGGPRNVERDSPIAAHVYEVAGTYVISVDGEDPDGNSGSDTETIVVTDWPNDTNTHCYSNASDFTDCPSGATQHSSVTSLTTAVNADKGTNRRLLFRRNGTGESFTRDAVMGLTNSHAGPGMVGGYGSGTHVAVTGAGIYFRCESTGVANDWRFVDIDPGDIGSGNTFVDAAQDGLNDRCAHWLALRVDGNNGQIWNRAWNAESSGNGSYPNDVPAVVDSTWACGKTGTVGGVLTLWMPNARGVIMGNTLSQPDPECEHTIRVNSGTGVYIGHNDVIGPEASNRHAIKLEAEDRNDPTPPHAAQDTFYSAIVHNYIEANLSTLTVDIGPEDDGAESYIKWVLFAGNHMKAGVNSQKNVRFAVTGYAWARNNFCDMTGTVNDQCFFFEQRGAGNVPSIKGDHLYATHNSCWADNNTGTYVCVEFNTGETLSPRVAYNNMIVGDTTLVPVSGADTEDGNVPVDSNEGANDPFVTYPPVNFADWRITNGSAADDQGVDGGVHASGDWEGDEHCPTPDAGADEESGC